MPETRSWTRGSQPPEQRPRRAPGGLAGIAAEQLRRELPQAAERLRGLVTGEAAVRRCANISELRRLARRRLPRAVFDYVDGAAADELTAARNLEDLRAVRVVPRILSSARRVNLSTTVLGQPLSVPLLGGPTGMTGVIHSDGEVGVARAVQDAGGLYVLSSAGSRGIDELALLAPGPRWFQLYLSRDRGLARALLSRAREHGYRALIVTVDVQRAGARERDRRNGFSVPPRLTARSLLDGLRRPRWSADFLRHQRVLSQVALNAGLGNDSPVALAELMNSQFDADLSWRDIAWLQEQWEGPLVIKGIMRAADAAQAARMGAAGVVVSNHGGRQLDGAPSTISVLPGIADAVSPELEVYFDGGIRRGIDILRALALGARACLCGRALLYGLAAGGQAGAEHAVRLLVDELALAMTLAGARSVSELDRGWIAPPAAAGQ